MKAPHIITACILLAAALAPGLSEGHTPAGGVDWKNIGIEEKLGKKIRLDAAFLDEHGTGITLKNALVRPTLVLPVYYYCTESCGMMLGNLAASLNEVTLAPGKDYDVLALSIDEEDGPESAMRSKKNYSKILTKDFPGKSWRYLSGTTDNIRLFTDSSGFKFKKTARHTFIHPNVLIVLARDGTVIRYLYGPAFLPFDIGMALTEAERGTPSLSIRKVMSYCFTYEAGKKSYAFTAVRYIVAGIIIILGLALFFLLRRKDAK